MKTDCVTLLFKIPHSLSLHIRIKPTMLSMASEALCVQLLQPVLGPATSCSVPQPRGSPSSSSETPSCFLPQGLCTCCSLFPHLCTTGPSPSSLSQMSPRGEAFLTYADILFRYPVFFSSSHVSLCNILLLVYCPSSHSHPYLE